MNMEGMDQNSIDSLFGSKLDQQGGTPVDFSSRRSLTADQMQILISLNQPVTRSLSILLSGWLDADIRLSMMAAERVIYKSYLSSLDLEGVYLTKGRFAISNAPALLHIDLVCVDAIVHYGLGGNLVLSAAQMQREPTLTDMEILATFLSKVWSHFNQVWAACGLHAEFEERVLATNLSKVFPSSEYLLAFTYVITIGSIEGSLQLCLPTMVADRLLKEIYRQESNHVQPPEVQQLMLQRLGHIMQKATLRLPAFPVRMSELARLKPGDIFNTGVGSATLAEFSIPNGPVWQSSPAKCADGRLCAKLVSSVAPS